MVKVAKLVPAEVQACLLNDDNLMNEVFTIRNCIDQVLLLIFLPEMLYGERDMGKVIDYIAQAPDGFFLYLTHSYSRNDTKHSYYNLKLVFSSFRNRFADVKI